MEGSQVSQTRQVAAISGGLVFDGQGFAEGSVAVAGEKFVAVQRAGNELGVAPAAEGVLGALPNPSTAAGGDVLSSSEGEVIDASGCYVIPGLIDVHFHGCMGDDFSDGDVQALHRIAAYEASRGVTGICPATMTLPTQTLERAMQAAASFAPAHSEAELVGINMEGPYISPNKVGAQNPAYVRPADIEEFRHLQQLSAGLIKLVDVAPEEPGALDFISQVSDEVLVSVAHTCADYDCTARAFQLGARHMTHLFNAMPGMHHRKPGPIPAGAERDDVTAELICDGVHVHAAMVRTAFELFGADRICMISDSLRAAGMPDGTYELGGQMFTVKGPYATIADGSLAGSVSDLMACLRTAVQQMGINLTDAVRACTHNPAAAIGIDKTRGQITPGYVADAVVLNRDLSVRHVVMRGRLLLTR